jgi:hypothetical protein
MVGVMNSKENTGGSFFFNCKALHSVSFYLSITQFIVSLNEPTEENKYSNEVRNGHCFQQQ